MLHHARARCPPARTSRCRARGRAACCCSQSHPPSPLPPQTARHLLPRARPRRCAAAVSHAKAPAAPAPARSCRGSSTTLRAGRSARWRPSAARRRRWCPSAASGRSTTGTAIASSRPKASTRPGGTRPATRAPAAAARPRSRRPARPRARPARPGPPRRRPARRARQRPGRTPRRATCCTSWSMTCGTSSATPTTARGWSRRTSTPVSPTQCLLCWCAAGMPAALCCVCAFLRVPESCLLSLCSACVCCVCAVCARPLLVACHFAVRAHRRSAEANRRCRSRKEGHGLRPRLRPAGRLQPVAELFPVRPVCRPPGPQPCTETPLQTPTHAIATAACLAVGLAGGPAESCTETLFADRTPTHALAMPGSQQDPL